MKPEIAEAILRMCNNIRSACPASAPEGWTPPVVDPLDDFMKQVFGN